MTRAPSDTTALVDRAVAAMGGHGPHIHRVTINAGTGKVVIHRLPIGFKVFHKQRWKTDGWVYFIRGGDVVKIGFAKEVGDRLPKLQTGSPVRLTFLLGIEAKQESEGEFHRRFAAYRTQGEWFRMEGALSDFLDRYYLMQRRSERTAAGGAE